MRGQSPVNCPTTMLFTIIRFRRDHSAKSHDKIAENLLPRGNGPVRQMALGDAALQNPRPCNRRLPQIGSAAQRGERQGLG